MISVETINIHEIIEKDDHFSYLLFELILNMENQCLGGLISRISDHSVSINSKDLRPISPYFIFQ